VELKKKQQGEQRSYQEPDVGDGDWLREFRTEAGKWNGKKLVVLSLFDGIGGVWAALKRMDIPFVGYSSEVVRFPPLAFATRNRAMPSYKSRSRGLN
jgi:hypothetical protein